MLKRKKEILQNFLFIRSPPKNRKEQKRTNRKKERKRKEKETRGGGDDQRMNEKREKENNKPEEHSYFITSGYPISPFTFRKSIKKNRHISALFVSLDLLKMLP